MGNGMAGTEVAILKGIMNESFNDRRLKSHADTCGKNMPHEGNSWCKGPAVEACTHVWQPTRSVNMVQCVRGKYEEMGI